MWGRKGPSIAPDGTLYTGTGDGSFHPENQSFGQAIIGVKQDPATKALALQDYYGPSNAEWLLKRDLDIEVTPAIFEYKGRELMVGSSKECRIWLMDAKSLGGEDHRTPLYRTPILCNEEVNMNLGIWGAMATWEDAKGTRWIVAPLWGPLHSGIHAPIEYGPVVHGATATFKLKDTNGQLSLDPAWISRDMNLADLPAIANGVVLRVRQRRKRGAALAGSGAYFGHCGKNRRIDARGVVCARWSNGKRAVVEWRSDRFI